MIKKGTPSKADCLSSKEKLLKAALDIFAKAGFSGATTKSISSHACVNEALISRHFQSKAGLFMAVIEQRFEDHSLEHEYPRQANLLEEFCTYSEILYKTLKENGELLRVLISHAMIDIEFANTARERIREPYSKAFHQRLLDLQAEKKIIADSDAMTIQMTIKHLTTATFQNSCLLRLVDEEAAKKELKAALGYLARGLASI